MDATIYDLYSSSWRIFYSTWKINNKIKKNEKQKKIAL